MVQERNEEGDSKQALSKLVSETTMIWQRMKPAAKTKPVFNILKRRKK